MEGGSFFNFFETAEDPYDVRCRGPAMRLMRPWGEELTAKLINLDWRVHRT